jgi:hypothetical protein
LIASIRFSPWFVKNIAPESTLPGLVSRGIDTGVLARPGGVKIRA